MAQLKQRTELLNQLTNAMKDKDSASPGACGYVGALPTPAPVLHYRNDPVMFFSKVAEALKVVRVGSLNLEPDRQVLVTGQIARLPEKNEMTHVRILFLHRMLPQGMAVTRTLTQKEPVEVFDVNGSRKYSIPMEFFTAVDCLRLLVAESTIETATRKHAERALRNITLLPGELWASAIDRLTLVFRAATVTPDRPALSEEEYFWQVITMERLQRLCDQAILLCCTGSEDISTFRLVLLQRGGQYTDILQRHPADMHAPGSPAMVARGTATRHCFYGFTDILKQNSQYYRHPVGGKSKSAGRQCDGNTEILPTAPGTGHVLPPDEANWDDVRLGQTGRRRGLQADYIDEGEHGDEQIAAYGGADSRQPDTTMAPSDGSASGYRRPRGDTPRGRRDSTSSGDNRGPRPGDTRRRDNHGSERSHFQDRATRQYTRPTPNTSETAAGATSDASRKRGAPWNGHGATEDNQDRRPRGPGNPTPSTSRNRRKAQLAADAPRPGDSTDSAISEYISRHRVCFSHAHGETCRRMAKRGQCPYSHADDPIPFNSYPRDTALAALMGDEDEVFYESNSTVLTLRLAEWAADARQRDAPIQEEQSSSDEDDEGD